MPLSPMHQGGYMFLVPPVLLVLRGRPEGQLGRSFYTYITELIYIIVAFGTIIEEDFPLSAVKGN